MTSWGLTTILTRLRGSAPTWPATSAACPSRSWQARPLTDRITRLGQAEARPFGVNFTRYTQSPADRAEVELAASRARLVKFFWTDPALVELVHAGGALDRPRPRGLRHVQKLVSKCTTARTDG